MASSCTEVGNKLLPLESSSTQRGESFTKSTRARDEDGEEYAVEKGKGLPALRSTLPLPPELMAQCLLYADGATLTHALAVAQVKVHPERGLPSDGLKRAELAAMKAMRNLVTAEHWRMAATPVRWVQGPSPDPDSFTSPEQSAVYWRRLCRLAPNGVPGTSAGRMVVLGGSQADRPGPTSTAEACVDVEWGKGLLWETVPAMMSNRCAAAAAVDRWGHVHVVGGWSGLGAHSSCERLLHPEARSTLASPVFNDSVATMPYSFPRRRDVDVLTRKDAASTRRHAGAGIGGAARSAMRAEARQWAVDVFVVVGVDGRVSHRSSEPYRAPQAQTGRRDVSGLCGGGGAGVGGGRIEPAQVVRAAAGITQQGWTALPDLVTQRCFLGAAFEPRGGLLAIGGGTGLYTNATAFETVEVLPQNGTCWTKGPSMSQARCGLGVATLPDGKIYAAGGYGGDMKYLRSVEVLDPDLDRWTISPPMSRPRTGLGLAAGPDGSVYAVGGSADGSHGHSSMERFDPREGKWSRCPSMVFGRAYCCAAFGASGNLYVLGGMSTPTGFMRTVEIYDPRRGRWRVDDRLGDGSRAITDACLVFQP